jgi:predicted transcriptional regulator
MAEREELLQLAADIVSAHASNNPLSADQLPGLIQQVFSTLATVQQKAAAPPRPEPAVPVRASVHQDHLVCLDCGRHFSMLKRHLMSDHNLTPEQYRERWQLSPAYPIDLHWQRGSVWVARVGQ